MFAIKVFRVNKQGQPCYLFHGKNGSCVHPLNKWVKAERKMVQDGSGNTLYESGFHAFTSVDGYKSWLKTVKKHYAWTIVEVKGIRKKGHSKNFDVILANQMKLSSKDWQQSKDRYDFEKFFRESMEDERFMAEVSVWRGANVVAS